MKKKISQLTIVNRFRLTTGAIVLTIAICSFLVWNLASLFIQNLETLTQISDEEIKLVRMRNNYNGIRGDMLTLLLADPLTQQSFGTTAEALYHERASELQKDVDDTIRKDALPANLITLRNSYYQEIRKYLAFCNANLKHLQQVPRDDSVNFSKACNLMVVDFATHYTPLRNCAIAAIDAMNAYKKESLLQANHDRIVTTWVTLGICLAMAILIIVLQRVINTSILEPVKQTQQTLEDLSAGKLTTIQAGTGKDELSAMLRSTSLLHTHMSYLVDFAGNVAQNNFAVKAAMFDGNGPIASALVHMRDSLKTAYAAEKLHSWSNEGLSKFSELIRNHQQDPDQLSLEVIRFLSNYLKTQQAGLFVLQGELGQEQWLELKACYAMDRRKFINKKIAIGEGLIGQTYLEGDTIFLTDIPQGYTTIRSGLGDATPTSLVIIPMKYNDRIEAIIELAGFHVFEPHEIQFLERAGEFVASAIVNAKTTASMQRILAESQQQAEELRAQEEEVRQNLEELSSTQEEIMRSKTLMEQMLTEQQEQVTQLKAQEAEMRKLNEEMESVREKEEERAATQINSQKEMMVKMLEKQKQTEQQLNERIQELERQLNGE